MHGVRPAPPARLALARAPGLIDWDGATVAGLHRVRALGEAGAEVFLTVDAGPQIKAICAPDDAAAVRAGLAALPGWRQWWCRRWETGRHARRDGGAPGEAGTGGGLCAVTVARAHRAAMPGRVAHRGSVARRGQWQFQCRWFAARVAARAGLANPRGVAAVAPWALGAGAACAV